VPAALDADDAQAVLDAVRKVSIVENLDDFRTTTLAAIRGLVPCDGAGYNEVDPTVPSIVFVTDPLDYADKSFSARFERYAHEHPLLRHMQTTGDGSARRISEFLTQDEFHALELYRDLYEPMGVEFQVGFTLPAPLPLVIAIVATSGSRDFSVRDCAVLDALRPHLVQAYRRAALHERMHGDLEALAQAVVGPHRGVALVEPDGALRFVDDASEAVLDRYLGADRSGVAAWVEAQRARLRTGPTVPAPFDPLVVATNDRGRLVVRFVPGRGGTDVVVLHDAGSKRDPSPLQALGLTPREAEVLLLVTEGESNDTIASAIGAQPGTVRKHLEHIFRKLGVRNRTEAAAAAFEVLALFERT
jgi:DNA-binding NarL/FixJ family response regulator